MVSTTAPACAQQRNFVFRTAEDRLVMAVAVDQDVRADQPAGGKSGSLRGQPVGQQPDVLAESRLARASLGNSSSSSSLKTLAQLGSRKMNGRPASICGSHAVENLGQIGARRAQQAEIVERPAAADVALRNFNGKAGLGQNGFRGRQGLRVVVVVPGVRP